MHRTHNRISIAMALAMAMLFSGCADRYERVGQEAAPNIYPQGVAEDFTLTYTEAQEPMGNQESADSRVVVVLKSPRNENYENLTFKHQIFPEGLHLDFFDEEGRKSEIEADFALVYSATNLIDLRGNVVLVNYDGKRLETQQLYWDRENNWIFTEGDFTYTNPEEGTVMNGTGMDFDQDLSHLDAAKTYGVMALSEDEQ